LYDLVIRGGLVVLPEGAHKVDVAVSAGQIVAVGSGLGDADRVTDATGMIVFPGVVDAHVHFGEPGRTHWEGYETGTKAAARGGVTTVIEMPQNQLPANIDAATLQTKFAAGREKIRVDVASYGALSDQSTVDGLKELNELGVVAYKAFMSPCGRPEEPSDQHMVDDFQLFQGMQTIAGLGKLLCVHAENGAIYTGLTEEYRRQGQTGLPEFVAAHPVSAEVEAVRRAIFFARETQCKLHICHISSYDAVQEVVIAAGMGVDVTCEVCPHFLIFDSDDLVRIGTALKCSPPLRDRQQRELLWHALDKGAIAFIASDHSPCPPEMKELNGLDAWGGTAALQTSLEMTYSEAVCRRKMPLSCLAALMAENPAKRFGIANKGAIAIGHDADFALLKEEPYTITVDTLEYRYPQISPYLGMVSLVQVQQTILRGEIIYDKHAGFSTKPTGQYI